MAIPQLKKEDIENALEYIDENGVPERNASAVYDLVNDGKKYPPKYVIAVADHLAHGNAISTYGYNAVEAKNFLRRLGFTVEINQGQCELTITSDKIESTDSRFTMSNIGLGDRYKPLGAYFEGADGKIIDRAYAKYEKRNCGQTLPKLACQVFEKELESLPFDEKIKFPVCRYGADGTLITGIYTSVAEYSKYRKSNTWEYLTYTCADGKQFIIYCWNIFSTLLFVQECLKRFGQPGDRFIFR